MKVIAEEVFGPVVTVEPYDDVEAAFDAVNAGRFGLQAGVYTNDLRVAQRAYILDNGLFVLQGSAADIRNDPDLKRAYLGM